MAFIDARDLAEQLRSQPLVFSASMALGLFLKEQGRQVEGKDHLGLALASLRRSLECVRAAPLLYTDRAGRVESLYEAIRDICLALEQWQAAFDYDEEKTAFLKIALVHNESPRFHSPEHRKAYDRYTGLNRNIETDYSVIRRLASRGLSIESPEMKKAMSRLEVDRKSLEDFVAEIQKIEPELSPFMILVRNDRPAPEGTAAVKLLETGGVTRAWIVQGKKTVHVSMKTGDYGPLAQAIKRMDRKRGIFVILSPEALKWIREDSASLRDIPVSMALSMEEASNWALENNRRQVRSILYIEKGRKGLMDLPSGIREYEKGETDITGCDIIIDSINSPAFNAGNLFNTRIRPALLLSKASDQESILKIAMAARYSGVSSLILFRDGEKTDLKALLDRLLREGGTSIIQSDLASPGLILLGAPLMPPSGAHDSAGLIRSTRDRYLEFMKRGRYADARIELNRWKSLSGDGIQTRRLYLDGMINLLLLQGKLTEAESLAGSAAGEDASVYSLFLKLYSGDIKAARSIIETSSVIRESREYPVFRGILDLLSGAEAHSVMKSLEDFISEGRTSGGPEKGSRISVERMLLLLSDYLDLTENGDESRRALSAMENMQGLSEREAIFMFTLDRTGLLSLEPSAKSPLIRAFLEDYRKGSMSFGAMTERIRSLSDEAEVPAALLLLLASRDDRRKNAFLSELAQWPLLRETLDRARWTDRLRLERMLALRLEASGETQKAHAYTESFLKAADERGIAPLRREAMTRGARELTAMKRFEQAHAIAREAETFTPENHKLHMPLQFVLLDCETSAVNPDAGMVRAEKLFAGKNLSRPDNFTLLLFRARIELKKLAAMKAPEKKDGRSMELLYMEILKVIDSHPQLLAGLERRYLLEEIADAYINYMMRTGDMSSALNYAEVKKHLLTRMDYSWRISGGAAKNFTATGIQAELRANPGLVMERVIPQLPLDVIRKRIPERAMILYSVRNGNSVFVWALGRDFRFATVLENRAAALEDISAAFSRNESDQAGVSGLSRRLMEIFSPVKEYIRRSETVYICADRFMEKVPFEIMGERQILWETHSVLFLSSLTFSLRSLQTGGRELTLHGGSLDERSAVEKTAISESGVRWHPGNPGGSMIHFLNPLVYEADKRRIMAASEDYSVAAAGKKSVCALIPVSEEGIALYSAALGISSCLINRASARDFNSPRFLERYYREISSGATAREAFDRARAALLARHEFGNQASGAFVRLYLNGI